MGEEFIEGKAKQLAANITGRFQRRAKNPVLIDLKKYVLEEKIEEIEPESLHTEYKSHADIAVDEINKIKTDISKMLLKKWRL